MVGTCQVSVTVLRTTTAVSPCGALGGADGTTVTTKLVVVVITPSLAASVMVDEP